MMIPRSRRVFAGTLMLALAPSAALLAGAPSATASPAAHASPAAGRTPAHAAASSHFGSLASVSVAPHSTTAFALGDHGTTTTGSVPYALRRTGSHWSKVKLASPTGSTLSAVAAGSATKAWVVGTSFAANGQVPFIDTLKGSHFTHTKTNLGTGLLVAAAASSATNAWAVGDTTSAAPLAAHLAGNKWKVVAVPSTFGALTAVSTTSAKNVWALSSVGGVPSSAHWNGKKWSAAPVAAAGVTVTGIATTSAKKVWAVGYHFVTSGTTETPRPLTFRWTGKAWKQSAAPGSLKSAFLFSVTVNGKHGYAVGLDAPGNGQNTRPLVLRLTNGKWKSEKVAKRGQASSLSSVSMSSKAASAVGQWSLHPQCTVNATPMHPFIVSPHGSSWGQVSAPEVALVQRRC